MLSAVSEGFSYAFRAMGSPCEVRVETHDAALGLSVGQLVETEARRIDQKYSRYQPDSLISQLNSSNGRLMVLDNETAALIDYAARIYELSARRFDITSGVLRRVWRFDGSDRVPGRRDVDELLPLVGWSKVTWNRPDLILPAGMELDLGGVGKEYAVDLAVEKAVAACGSPLLVNFGGDLRVSGPRENGGRWRVALDSVDTPGDPDGLLMISDGALTTSGDSRRYLYKDGVRYSHILDARTGWPVKNPPHSVTVAAPTCVEAGLLSTLAMLHGARAERFLRREGVQAWCVR